MELPDEILAHIKDFSRPITRPDWRQFKPMRAFKFHTAVMNSYNKMNLPVLNSFVKRYERQVMQYMYCRYVYDDSFISAVRVNIAY